MRLSRLFQLGLVGLSTATPFWRLDSSCKKNGLEDMVVEAVESAFSMAQNLQTPIENAINKKEIKASDGQVLEWMFMPDGHSYKTAYQVQRAADELNANLLKLITAKSRNDEASLQEADNIVIYCDMSRFEETNDKKRFHDKDVDSLLEKSDSITACKGVLPPVLAYTMGWEGEKKASQIQLCPWVLEWAQKLKGLIDAKDVSNKAYYIEKLANVLVDYDIILTPIDIESILDKLIFHEMTHTSLAGFSKDIDEGSLLKVRYGWKRCRALAKEGDTSMTRQGQHNADSIALAGFAIKLFGEGIQVHEDGSLTKP